MLKSFLNTDVYKRQTLLTVLLQAHSINYAVTGNGRKTVITLDMGLYISAKQLQMSRSDLDHIVLRPGELHIVMAALRCIGAFAENSGLDMAWIQSCLLYTSIYDYVVCS